MVEVKNNPALIDRQVQSSGAVKVQLDKYICETRLARYFNASFKWNQFSEPRNVYAMEDLRGEITGLSLKACLDLFRDRMLIDHEENDHKKAAEYREVFPMTLNCYTDTLTVDGHYVLLYETGSYSLDQYQGLELQPTKRLPIDIMIWLTERLLRITEALHADDMMVGMNRPIYLVCYDLKALRLMDFRRFCYVKEINYSDVRISLQEIAKIVRQIGDFGEDSSAVQKLDSFLKKIEQLPGNNKVDAEFTKQITAAGFREEYLRIFPEAK